MDVIHPPIGSVSTYEVREGKWCSWLPAYEHASQGLWLPGAWSLVAEQRPNLVLYDWASIAAHMTAGELKYRPAGLLFEYKNVDTEEETVDVPDYGRSDGIAYYNALSDNPDVDYLRVPLIASTVSSSDTDRYPSGNVVTYFGMTSGVEGVHGKDFAAEELSKVYGVALVAMPEPDDPTQDLVMSRFYYAAERQQLKTANQLSVRWPIAYS